MVKPASMTAKTEMSARRRMTETDFVRGERHPNLLNRPPAESGCQRCFPAAKTLCQ